MASPRLVGALHHAGITVRSLDEAIGRWNRLLGLHGEKQSSQVAVMRCGYEDYCLVLRESGEKPSVSYVCYELAPGVKLDDARQMLTSRGEYPSDFEVPHRGCALRLQDPDGNPVVLIERVRPADSRPAEVKYSDLIPAWHPRKLGHANFLTSDVKRVVKWYTEILDFKVTDWIGDEGVWLHVNTDHHVLAFLNKGYNHIHHLAFELVDWGELRVGLDHLAKSRRALVWGPGRHGMARNLLTYSASLEKNTLSNSSVTWNNLWRITKSVTSLTTRTLPTPGVSCRREPISVSTGQQSRPKRFKPTRTTRRRLFPDLSQKRPSRTPLIRILIAPTIFSIGYEPCDPSVSRKFGKWVYGESIQIVHDYLLSTIRGHAKIVDKMTRLTGSREERLDRYIAELKKLSFVHGVTVHTTERKENREFDALLEVKTAAGQYRLAAEISSLYPTQVILNSIVASARRFETQNRKKNTFYVVLLGRTAHVPEEKLLEKGINFIDLAGNMNLKLSENYQAVIVGRREKRLEESEFSRVSSRAGVQLLFTLAAHPDAANWPIRQLAEVSGISKSIVARLKHRLIRAEMLEPAGHEFRLRSTNEIREQILSGYGETLYP